MVFPKNLIDSEKISFVTFLAFYTAVLSCGTLPQGESAVRFNVSGFTLAAEMAYSETLDVQTRIPSLSKNMAGANKFFSDLIMNTVNDVLQEQGRQALLLDGVISLILQQLNVTIEYTPLECKTATSDPVNGPPMHADDNGCFVISGMVPSLCAVKAACNLMTGAMLKSIPMQHRFFTGSLRTSNIIMATWSRQMWQSVLNRVHRRLISGRYGTFFNTATVTVTS